MGLTIRVKKKTFSPKNSTVSSTDTNEVLSKDVIELYTFWYEKYNSTIQYITNLGSTIFVVTLGFLFNSIKQNLEPNSGSNSIFHSGYQINMFLISLAVIGIATLLAFIALFYNYRWYSAILEAFKDSSIHEYSSFVGSYSYTNRKKRLSTIRFTGIASRRYGLISGILLLVGLFMYGYSLFSLFLSYLK